MPNISITMILSMVLNYLQEPFVEHLCLVDEISSLLVRQIQGYEYGISYTK